MADTQHHETTIGPRHGHGHPEDEEEHHHHHQDPRALYISNLHYSVTDVQLGDAFEHEGFIVHNTEIIKKGMGAMKKGSGMAVLTLEKPEDKEKAMEVMAGKNLFGWDMVVRDDKFVEVNHAISTSPEPII